MRRLIGTAGFISILSAVFLASFEKPLFTLEAAMVKNVERFLELRRQSQGYLRPAQKEKIIFSIAEYYFAVNDYIDAKIAFEEFIAGKRSGIPTLLANVFLYKMSKSAGEEDVAVRYKKIMFQDQFILLFNEYKTLNYVSANSNHYEIRYFVDKIEIYLNGEIFEEVSP